MDTSLQRYPIPGDVREWLKDHLWQASEPGKQFDAIDLNPYLEYYSTRYLRSAREGGTHISIKSHSEIVDIAMEILKDATRTELCTSLGSPPDDVDIDRRTKAEKTVDMCASLLLMAEVGVPEYRFIGASFLSWSGPQTLRQAIGQHFRPEKVLQPDNLRMGKIFTARNLVYIGGIKVKWTNNIVDHLLLADDDQSVMVFHQVGFLRSQQTLHHPVFSKSFIDETLRTLALLFPQNDSKSLRWLRRQIVEHKLDPAMAKCGTIRPQQRRRFEHFSFWHDRLVILKQAFDESSPWGLKQWWNDRRNSVQWYTFWVAILVFIMTMFFGLVQSIAGALQVYLSWKALYAETT
ncbi:hypothetical protein OQA88_2926 [Cercophora sp. LCS_1]